jgi:hypothetical protein
VPPTSPQKPAEQRASYVAKSVLVALRAPALKHRVENESVKHVLAPPDAESMERGKGTVFRDGRAHTYANGLKHRLRPVGSLMVGGSRGEVGGTVLG